MILDPHSRREVGWAVSDRMKKELAIRTLSSVNRRRQGPNPASKTSIIRVAIVLHLWLDRYVARKAEITGRLQCFRKRRFALFAQTGRTISTCMNCHLKIVAHLSFGGGDVLPRKREIQCL